MNGDQPKLLVVDDDPQIAKQIRWALGDAYEVLSASDRQGALRIFRRERMSIVLLDLGLPPHPREADEGLAALREILAEEPLAKVIIVSGNAERENALKAVERGATDIFPKPIDLDELKVVLHRVEMRLALELSARRDARQESFEGIIGSSPAMRDVYGKLRRVAPTGVPVLITGESGTGKELAAQAIHRLSGRAQGPFVPVHCGAIPETLVESELFGHERGAFTGADARQKGKFEYARQGTLFLDEIGEMPLAMQVKLLRFLEESVIERVGGRESIPVDARFLAATNRDLEADTKHGGFREDLYFRIAVVRVHLPPLRERGEDVVELARHFTRVYTAEFERPPKQLSPDALERLRHHDWPGNVRELQNRLKRAVVLAEGPTIGPSELELKAGPDATDEGLPLTLREAREKAESELIAQALEQSGGNLSQAARALAISRPTLYELMDKLGFERPSRKKK